MKKLAALLILFSTISALGVASGAAPGPRCAALFEPSAIDRFDASKSDSIGLGYQWGLETTLRSLFDRGEPTDLRKFIAPQLRDPEFRAAMDRWLDREFTSQTRELVSSEFKGVRDVIIGAGPHTLTLLANQSSTKVAQTVVVERAKVGSTFHGKHFQMNSEERSGLNNLPGAIFQMSDIVSDSSAPGANDFGFLLRLNYRAARIRVIEGYEYKDVSIVRRWAGAASVKVRVERRDSGKTIVISAARLGIATGMDVRSEKHFEETAPGVHAAWVASEEGASLSETHGLATGAGFLRKVHRSLQGDDRPVFYGPRVGIIGSKHEGLTAVEGVLALIRAGRLPPDTKITVFGLKSSNREELRNEVTPKAGSVDFQKMIQRRYLGQGIPEGLEDKSVLNLPLHVTDVQIRRADSTIHVQTEDGRTHTFDMLIQTTGFERGNGAWARTKRSLEPHEKLQPVELRTPEFADPVGFGLVTTGFLGGSLLVYGFGVNAALPVSKDRLQGEIGNPDALYVTLPATALLGPLLEKH